MCRIPLFKTILVLLPLFAMIGCQANSQPSVNAAWLAPETLTQAHLGQSAPLHVYSFTASPDHATTLVLNADTPGFSFLAELRDTGSGEVVASVEGGAVRNASFLISPDDSLYEVRISTEKPEIPGTVSVYVGSATSPYPVTASDVRLASLSTVSAPVSGCTVSSAIGREVNVRSGPSLSYEVIGTLAVGAALGADMRSPDDWYRVSYNGRTGWIAGSVINRSAACANLALVSSASVALQQPPTPPAIGGGTAPVEACSVRSTTSGAVNVRSGPGMNYPIIGSLMPNVMLPVTGHSGDGWYQINSAGREGWVSNTVTQASGMCLNVPLVGAPLPTPTPLPIAPFDAASYALQVDRDGAGQVGEAISAPEGDHSDLIQMTVINLNTQPPDNYREFTLTLTCSGPGSEQVRWGSPESPLLGCGSTLAVPVLYALNEHTFAVMLPEISGPSFVNYTLMATATV